MNNLEDIEWTQYWSENNNSEFPHILLIGDSISVGYRGPVFKRLKNSFCVTTISTSKALDNSSFLNEIKFIANEEGFEFPAIHFNNGLHGFHLNDADYRRFYLGAAEFLFHEFPCSSLILATSTPCTCGENNQSFEKRNSTVLKRNETVFYAAEKFGLDVDDLYSAAVNHPEFKCDDGVHFSSDGYEMLAQYVADSVLSSLKGNNRLYKDNA